MQIPDSATSALLARTSFGNYAAQDYVTVFVRVPVVEFADAQSSLLGLVIAQNGNSGLVDPTSGNTSESVVSGTSSPSYTPVSMTTSGYSNTAEQWMRVGNTVTVSGSMAIAVTAGNNTFRLTLPVASNFTNGGQLGGIPGGPLISNGRIYSDSSNDEAFFNFTATAGAFTGITYTYTYQVLT